MRIVLSIMIQADIEREIMKNEFWEWRIIIKYFYRLEYDFEILDVWSSNS